MKEIQIRNKDYFIDAGPVQDLLELGLNNFQSQPEIVSKEDAYAFNNYYLRIYANVTATIDTYLLQTSLPWAFKEPSFSVGQLWCHQQVCKECKKYLS